LSTVSFSADEIGKKELAFGHTMWQQHLQTGKLFVTLLLCLFNFQDEENKKTNLSKPCHTQAVAP
jgi:hypothetical protein